MWEVTKILVPIDFSDCSKEALEHAAYLGRELGATLHVLHVWEPPRYVIPEVTVQVEGAPAQSLVEFARSEAGKEMGAFLARFKHEKELKVHGLLESGDPTEVVIDLAQRESYDLVVMGTHGRRGLSHLFLGSVAEKVVRRAQCPELTVHRHHPDEPATRVG